MKIVIFLVVCVLGLMFLNSLFHLAVAVAVRKEVGYGPLVFMVIRSALIGAAWWYV
jgi:UPF0716 family protein affecting phage T7 exclusion